MLVFRIVVVTKIEVELLAIFIGVDKFLEFSMHSYVPSVLTHFASSEHE